MPPMPRPIRAMPRKLVFPRRGLPILARRYRHGNHYRHYHDFIEIALVLEGEGFHTSAQGVKPMKPGAALSASDRSGIFSNGSPRMRAVLRKI